jgi:AraC-like DNA-binding protein
VEFGKDLYMESAKAIPYNIRDLTMAHMHQGYELLLLLDPIPYSAIINGKVVRETGPVAMIIAPFCMHFTYYLDHKVQDKIFSAFYIGDDFMRQFPEDIVPLKSLIGNDQAVLLDLSGFENQINEVLRPMMEIYQNQKRVPDHFFRETDVKQKLLFGLLINLLAEWKREKSVKRVFSKENYIYEIVTYIVQNIDKNLSTPEIANRFFVSRDKLNRDFKQYTQMTVKDFVSQTRINFAKSRLTDTKQTITEISHMCGFENDIYFYSFFKKHTGMTPRQYAAKMRK